MNEKLEKFEKIVGFISMLILDGAITEEEGRECIEDIRSLIEE